MWANVLLLYVSTLKDQFPTIAGHLVSASILSAPAALVLLVAWAVVPLVVGYHRFRESDL